MSDLSETPRESIHAAQKFVIASLVQFTRIRLAAQRGPQRRMSLAMLRATFDEQEVRHQHLSGNAPDPGGEGPARRGDHQRMRDAVLQEIASGLTQAECDSLGVR